MTMGQVKFLVAIFRRKRVTTDRIVAVDSEEDYYTRNDHSSVMVSERKSIKLCREETEKLSMDSSRVIGYGGFSTVYLARSSMVAVKMYCSSSQRLYQMYKQELDILRRLQQHDNIVKLLGYCDDPEKGALILEYIPNGNLQEKLHGSHTSLLPWERRMAIAFQLAQAVAHLHEKCSPHIIHGDIKPSNILLDDNLNCKLCDFGSAKMGFSSAVLTGPPDSNPNFSRNNRRLMVGSPGYTDPVYLKTGVASKKNDIYSFGVVVLELITGMEAIDPERGERLANRAEQMLENTEMVMMEIVDRRLNGEVDLEEARAMIGIAAKCVCGSTSIRPTSSDIVAIMRSEISSLSFFFQKQNL
ncbi:hypothetical protein OROGR_010451 [Orobanche gracilis]